MKIVLIGLGQVGRSVVPELIAHDHEVVVVDLDPEAVRAVEEHWDVGAVTGYGAGRRVLRDAGCKTADLVAAVTSNDEVNLVAALTARKMGAKRALARVQGDGWSDLGDGDGVELGILGIDVVFNPRVLTARELARVVRSHGAVEVIDLAEDRVEVAKLPVAETSRFAGKQLARINLPKQVKVGAIVRDDTLFVPGGADVLMAGDEVYLVGRRADIDSVQEFVTSTPTAARVCIMGGTIIGRSLAEQLVDAGVTVTLIEENPDVAQRLAEQLDKVTVVVADGTDMDVLTEHRIDTFDMFAAVTRDEEVNLLAGLLAKRLGVHRVGTVIERGEFGKIYHQLGIDVVLSPLETAAVHVLRTVRDDTVRSLSRLEQGQAEILEIKVPPKARIAGKPLMKVRFPRGALVCAVVKPDKVVVPGGDDTIEPGDTAIVLTIPDAAKAVEWIFKPGVF